MHNPSQHIHVLYGCAYSESATVQSLHNTKSLIFLVSQGHKEVEERDQLILSTKIQQLELGPTAHVNRGLDYVK